MDDTFSLIGQTIGKYRIMERLGRGGMAEVYKGYDENLERFVAIKVMHPFLASEGDFVGRFRREAKAMAALNHANIIKVYDFDAAGDRSYIVMEYLSQGSLKEKLEEAARRGEHISLGEAVQIILQIANALAYAHSRGMIHRDIKPPNIMFNDYGSAILTDFGIAKVVSGPTFTQTGAMIGSPAYMSPEQGLGKPGDERSDIYSLGVLSFQLVTGQLPYAADTPLAVVLKHVNAPVPDPSTLNPIIPEGVRAVITRAMAKDPDERYASAKALADDLRGVIRGGDAALFRELPAELFKDQPTPLPLSGVTPLGMTGVGTGVGTRPQVIDKTQVVSPPDKTALIPQEKTMVAPPDVAVVVSEGGERGRKFPRMAAGVAGMVLLLLLAIAGGFILAGGNNDTETPTVTIALAAVDDNTPTIPATETATNEPTPTDEPTSTPTLTPAPAETVVATTDASAPPTLAATLTLTPDATGTQVALCAANPAVQVLNIYTYSNTQSQLAPAGTISMRLNFVLENNSESGCVWPAELQIAHVEGEDFNLPAPFVFTAGQAPGESVIVTLTGLDTPNQVTALAATWQVQTLDGQPFGDPIEFEIRTYIPPTATPSPSPTVPVVTSPTVVAGTNPNFNYFFSACDYPGGAGGSEYRCTLTLTPYDGSGVYTFEVFDSPTGQPVRYSNVSGNVNHYVNSRRCASWIHEVKLIDEGSGQQISKNIFFDPTGGNYFPGGLNCVLPS